MPGTTTDATPLILRIVSTVILLMVLVGLAIGARSRPVDVIPGVCYASKCRSTTQRDRFVRLTGYDPKQLGGARPGWVVDHLRSLRCHGADLPSNMWWQTIEEARAKDLAEDECARYIPFDTTALDSTGRAVPQ